MKVSMIAAFFAMIGLICLWHRDAKEEGEARLWERPMQRALTQDSATAGKESHIKKDTGKHEKKDEHKGNHTTNHTTDEKDKAYFDVLSKAIHPQKFPPFYLMPVLFATKILITMLVFGPGLAFKAKPPDESCFGKFKSVGKYVAKLVSSLVFIALACNGYYVDSVRYGEAVAGTDSFWMKCGILTVVVLTSSNYTSTRALWNGLLIDNPGTLLQLEPKYPAVPYFKIPIVPGQANWIDPLKHIYALILLPYFLPYYALSVVTGIFIPVWCCCINKCVVCWGVFTGTCCCLLSLLGTIVTFGLYAYAKSTFAYWWDLYWPLYYIAFIQGWATGIAPFIFAIIYGCLICASPQSFASAFKPKADTNAPESALTQAAPLVDTDDRMKLIAINKESLEKDYDLSAAYETPSAATLEAVDLNDTKIKMFHATCRGLSSIVVEQITAITTIRVLTSTTTDEYFALFKATVTERTMANYLATLRHVAAKAETKALDAYWNLR